MQHSQGFIKRNLRAPKASLWYYTYIRSKLKYANVIWSTLYLRLHDTIERVQRIYLKYSNVVATHNKILSDRFNTKSLKLRRTQAGLVFLHKLIHIQIDCIATIWELNIYLPRMNSRKNQIFRYCHCCLLIKSLLYVVITHSYIINVIYFHVHYFLLSEY